MRILFNQNGDFADQDGGRAIIGAATASAVVASSPIASSRSSPAIAGCAGRNAFGAASASQINWPALVHRRLPGFANGDFAAGKARVRNAALNTWGAANATAGWVEELSRQKPFQRSLRPSTTSPISFRSPTPLCRSSPQFMICRCCSIRNGIPADRVQWYEDHFARKPRASEPYHHGFQNSPVNRSSKCWVFPAIGVTSVANGPATRVFGPPYPARAIAEVVGAGMACHPQYLLYVREQSSPRKKTFLRLMQAYISLPAGVAPGIGR